MVIYDLVCKNDHRFEGWFPSFEEFQKQAAKKLLSCPTCGDTAIEKLPHACAVHVKKQDAAPSRQLRAEAVPVPAASAQEFKELLLKVHHYINQNFENVGARFAEEARQIHSGQAANRPIHGTATAEEREALSEEGVPYVVLPKPELDS
jgi:hypothetical protein